MAPLFLVALILRIAEEVAHHFVGIGPVALTHI
jgi:hypothetical protein